MSVSPPADAHAGVILYLRRAIILGESLLPVSEGSDIV